MKVLIVDDEFASRRLLQAILSPHGECDVAVNGTEAVEAFRLAWEEKRPYDLVCLDIMMPEMDGNQALKKIREMEKDKGIKGSDEVKVIMTTALGDPKTVIESFYRAGATGYVVKPINHKKLIEEIRALGLNV